MSVLSNDRINVIDFPFVSGSNTAWQSTVADPIFVFKFWYFIHHGYFALILKLKKDWIKILYILIAKIFNAPLNFAPEASTRHLLVQASKVCGADTSVGPIL